MIDLVTNRVRLRRFQASDLNNMRRLESDPDVVKYTRIRIPITIEQSQERLTKLLSKAIPPAPLGVWAAEFKDNAEFIGWFMLVPDENGSAELGYMIVKDLWGQGLVSEISQRLVEAAFFSLNLKSIVAVTDFNNSASARILEKLRFKVKKQDTQDKSISYELKNHDWQPTLVGEHLTTEPLKSKHFEILYQAASDPLIWDLHPNRLRYQRPVFQKFFDSGIEQRGALLIRDAQTQTVIGSSSFYQFNIFRREVVVGYTFLTRAYWGGSYNKELKKMMLEYAFNYVDSVFFDVGEHNYRSQKALTKIGATLSGKRDELGPEGQPMLTLRYEILKSDYEI